MAAAYCDVAVPLPLHETFTYKIPVRLNAQVCAGCRVAVPFGSRKLVGVVTVLLDTPRVTGPLKEVEALLDAEPVLPASLLALGRWVSEYYAAPPGEVVRAMLPLHDEFALRERARLRPLGSQRLAELEPQEERSESEEAEYQIVYLLKKGKSRRVGGVARRVQEVMRVVAGLGVNGWL